MRSKPLTHLRGAAKDRAACTTCWAAALGGSSGAFRRPSSWLAPRGAPRARGSVWVPSLGVAGAACFANAARCGRRHCFVTGPLRR